MTSQAPQQIHLPEGRIGPADVLVVATCIAIATGLVEAGLLAISTHVLGHFTRVSPYTSWQAPIAYSGLFLVLAVALLPGLRLGQAARTLQGTVFLCSWLGGTGVLFLHPRIHPLAATLLAAGVAVQVARFAGRHQALIVRLARWTLLPGILTIPVLFLASTVPARRAERRALDGLPPAAADSPNVLLIIWDTVRAASLSLYGHDRETTPNLKALAQQGVTFDNAFSTAPWTTPSHASLFTGLYPFQTSVDWVNPLDGSPRTLAEALSAAGYRTAGITANTFATSRESGLARGFSSYRDFTFLTPGDLVASMSLVRSFLTRYENWRGRLGVGHMPGAKSGVVVEREFLAWLDRGEERPFFAFLNFFDAHAPYLPPEPYDTLFGPRLPGRDPHLYTGRKYTPRERQAELDAYEGAIRWLDDRLGHLLGELRKRGLLENTVLVLTADHGEEFGEHALYTHGHSLYDAVLHVPLVIVAPERVPAGNRIDDFVTLKDVPATILQVIGLQGGLPGNSLTRYWRDDTPPAAPDTVVSTVDQVTGNPPWYPVSQSDMAAVFADPLKLVRGANGSVQLFDLRTDRGETHDLADNVQWRPQRDTLVRFLDRLGVRR